MCTVTYGFGKEQKGLLDVSQQYRHLLAGRQTAVKPVNYAALWLLRKCTFDVIGYLHSVKGRHLLPVGTVAQFRTVYYGSY